MFSLKIIILQSLYIQGIMLFFIGIGLEWKAAKALRRASIFKIVLVTTQIKVILINIYIVLDMRIFRIAYCAVLLYSFIYLILLTSKSAPVKLNQMVYLGFLRYYFSILFNYLFPILLVISFLFPSFIPFYLLEFVFIIVLIWHLIVLNLFLPWYCLYIILFIFFNLPWWHSRFILW
jgi:hypothetical protein